MNAQTQPSPYEAEAQTFLALTNSRLEMHFDGHRAGYFDPKDPPRDVYRVQLIRDVGYTEHDAPARLPVEKGLSFTFGQSVAHSMRSIRPTAYAILACLDPHDPGTFAEFCREFGYSDDSIRAHEAYMEVKRQARALAAMYSEDELEQLAAIQ